MFPQALLCCSLSLPASWQQFTQENLERARQRRELSMKLRGEMDALLKASATDVWSQHNCVTNAFNARIQQTRDAISKLQCHLQKVPFFVAVAIVVVAIRYEMRFQRACAEMLTRVGLIYRTEPTTEKWKERKRNQKV